MRNTPVFVALLSLFFACRSSGNGGDDTIDGPGSGGNFMTIQQVQDPSTAAGTAVSVQNVVVTAVDLFGTRTGDFWIEEPEGGPFSGVLVFPPAAALTTVSTLVPGDIVTITGAEKDDFALTGSNADTTGRTDTELEQITGGKLTITVTGSGAVPAPSTIDLVAIGKLFDPSQDGSGGNGGGSAFNAAWQMWEGVLVTATNVDAFSAPKAFGSGGADQYDLSITGDAKMEGSLVDITQSGIGVDTCLATLTGVVDYFYDFLIYPRTTSDFATGGTGCVFENAANGSAACTDGIDNDGNGFTDCEDLGCEVGANAYVGTSCVGTAATTCGCSANEAAGAGAAAVQAVSGTNKPAMILNSVVVTAVGKSGFWVADNAVAATGHGTFVFTSSTPPASAVIGATLTVQGLGEQFGTGAITEPEVEDPTIIGTPTTGATLTPLATTVAIATGATTGAPYIGSLVKLTGPFIVTAVTTHDYTMTDGTTSFTMADSAFPTFGGTAPVVNDCYASLTGVMDLFTQTRTVNPRSATDMPAFAGTVNATTCAN